jgi:hypothetical protein
MPQLDFLSFPNQAVLLTLVLTILVFLLYIFILPDLLLIQKTNKELLHTIEANNAGTNPMLSPLLPHPELLDHFDSNTNTPTKSTTSSFHTTSLQQKFSLEESQAFFYALTQNNQRFFLPFFLFIRPFDTFLLTLSFLAFFSLLYLVLSQSVINPLLNEALYQKEALYMDLFNAKNQNYAIQLSLLQKEATLADTCRYLANHQISFLLHRQLLSNRTNSKVFSSLPQISHTSTSTSLQELSLPHLQRFTKDIHPLPSKLFPNSYLSSRLFLLTQRLKRANKSNPEGLFDLLDKKHLHTYIPTIHTLVSHSGKKALSKKLGF